MDLLIILIINISTLVNNNENKWRGLWIKSLLWIPV